MWPVLFHLPGGRPLYTYGAMLGLGVLVGVIWTGRRGSARRGLGREPAANAALIAALAGLAGARALYVAVNPVSTAESVGVLSTFFSGGLLGVGGAVTGFGAAALYLRAKGLSVLAFGDAVAPALGLFYALVRIGSYLYGSDFGIRLDAHAPRLLRWLGTFPRWEMDELLGPPVLVHHIDRFFVSRDASQSLPVHPVQLYEAALGLLVLFVALRRDRVHGPAGHVFLPAALALLGGRLLLEYVRDDPDRGYFFGFSVTQLGCLLLIPLLLLVWQQVRRDDTCQAGR